MLDESNVVVQVIVGKNEDETWNNQPMNWEAYYGGKRTSSNTLGGVHLAGGTPFRKNFAGVGYTYDPVRDAFIPPKPSNDATLDEATCQWIVPVIDLGLGADSSESGDSI